MKGRKNYLHSQLLCKVVLVCLNNRSLPIPVKLHPLPQPNGPQVLPVEGYVQRCGRSGQITGAQRLFGHEPKHVLGMLESPSSVFLHIDGYVHDSVVAAHSADHRSRDCEALKACERPQLGGVALWHVRGQKPVNYIWTKSSSAIALALFCSLSTSQSPAL